MKQLTFIAILTFFGAGSAKAQMYQESMEERMTRKPTYEEFLVTEIRKFPEVKRKEDQILKQSGNLKHAIYMIDGDGLGTYTIKIMEDNGRNQVTHLKYTVDSASGRILTEGKR